MLTIGQLAKEAGVGVETIRFYEREGLLAAPRRSPSGCRQYTPEAAERVKFLRRVQWLEFTLRDAQELLALRDNPDAGRAHVRERAADKLADIDERIAELRAMRAELARLLTTCRGGGPAAGGPIIAALGADAPVGRPRSKKSQQPGTGLDPGLRPGVYNHP